MKSVDWTRAGLNVSETLGSWVQLMMMTEVAAAARLMHCMHLPVSMHACMSCLSSSSLSGLEFLAAAGFAGGETESEEECGAHCSTEVDESEVAPIHGIPFPEFVVHWPTKRVHAVEMTKVGNEQAEQEDAPDASVVGYSQDEGFIEGLPI